MVAHTKRPEGSLVNLSEKSVPGTDCSTLTYIATHYLLLRMKLVPTFDGVEFLTAI